MTAIALDSGELVRFVLARLDEDRSELATLRRRAALSADTPSAGTTAAVPTAASSKAALRPGVQSLDRQRDELNAKRRMVASLQQLMTMRDLPAEKFVRSEAMTMLRALALPYAWHREYRQQWHMSTR